MITFYFKSFGYKIEKVHVDYPIYNEIIAKCTPYVATCYILMTESHIWINNLL